MWQGLQKGQFLAAALLALTLGVSSVAPVLAEDVTGTLAKLEEKYFQHDYPKDEVGDRLARIEQLMFGETKQGSVDDRLKAILALVPNLNEKVVADQPAAPAPQQTASRPSAPAAPTRPQRQAPIPPPQADDDRSVVDEGTYPAVTAIEKKILGRDHIGESVGKRLDRLEIKAFGKTTSSEDLQDRLDRLKSATGVDISRNAPAGSDWSDEDDGPDLATMPPRPYGGSQPGSVQPYSGLPGEDGRSFSGRDLRKDLSNAFNRPSYNDPYAGSGTFGSGAGAGAAPQPSRTAPSSPQIASRPASPSYVPGGMPPTAPDMVHRGQDSVPAPAPSAMGLQQQVALLEREVFRKSFQSETIPSRLTRLESTVFPQDKPAAERSLPERVNRLLAAVPLSQGADLAQKPQQQKRKQDDLGFEDDGMPPTAAAPQRQAGGGGGLGKIINGLGNMLTGGMTGGGYGYGNQVPVGNLVSDPQTGLLWDQYTGTLIDPLTGAVVGRKSVQYGGSGSMGTGYGGFNSGFSPMSPYGAGGSGMRFGFGSGGIGFGQGAWP